jgi:hypothetical protein
MELGITLGLLLVILAAGIVTRLTRPRRPPGDGQSRNIYPMW